MNSLNKRNGSIGDGIFFKMNYAAERPVAAIQVLQRGTARRGADWSESVMIQCEIRPCIDRASVVI
jgi:hypothetical protein